MRKAAMEDGELEEGEIEEEEEVTSKKASKMHPKLHDLFGSKDCDWRLAAPQPYGNSFSHLEPFTPFHRHPKSGRTRGGHHPPNHRPTKPLAQHSHQESYEELVNKYWRLQKELRSIDGKEGGDHGTSALKHPAAHSQHSHSKKNTKKLCKKKCHAAANKKERKSSHHSRSGKGFHLDEEDPNVLELRRVALESRSKLGSLLKKFKDKNKENVSKGANSEEQQVPDVNNRIMDMEISDSEAMTGLSDDTFMPLEDIDEMLEEDYLRAEALNSLKHKLANSSQEETEPPCKKNKSNPQTKLQRTLQSSVVESVDLTSSPEAVSQKFPPASSSDQPLAHNPTQPASSTEDLNKPAESLTSFEAVLKRLLETELKKSAEAESQNTFIGPIEKDSKKKPLESGPEGHSEVEPKGAAESSNPLVVEEPKGSAESTNPLVEEEPKGATESTNPLVEEEPKGAAESTNPLVEEESKDQPLVGEVAMLRSIDEMPRLESPILLPSSRSNSPVGGVLAKPPGWWAPASPKPLVINLEEDDSSSESSEESLDGNSEFKADVENFLQQARENTKKPPVPTDSPGEVAPAVAPLSKAQQSEYIRLKKEILRRERSRPNQELKKKLLLRKSQEAKAKLDSTKDRMRQNTEELHAVRCEMEVCKKDILSKKKEITMLQKLILQHNAKLSEDKVRFRRLTEKSAKLSNQIKNYRATIAQLQTDCARATKMASDFLHAANGHEVNKNNNKKPSVGLHKSQGTQQQEGPAQQATSAIKKSILHTLAPWALPLPPPFSLPTLESIPVPPEPSSTPPLAPVEATPAYTSPLLQLACSRLNPAFRSNGQSGFLSSTHFVHGLDPKQVVCRFDLLGSCNNNSCKWQHSENYVPPDNAILRNLLSYSPQIAGVLKSDSNKAARLKMDQYIVKLQEQHPDKNLEDLCAIVAKEVSVTLGDDDVLPRPQVRTSCAKPPTCEESSNIFSKDWRIKRKIPKAPVTVGEEDDDNAEGARYFNRDAVVPQQQPSSLRHPPSTAELEEALSSLSSALEGNRTDPQLWMDYLGLYCQHPDSSQDLPSLCLQATTLCPDPSLFWMCIDMVEPWDTKTQLCQKLVDQLVAQDPTDSDQLLRAVLYQTNLLQQACSTAPPLIRTLASQEDSPLQLQDRTFLWLCILALECFVKYPCRIFHFDLTLSSKKPFLLPWRCVNPDMPQKDVLELFERAFASCGSESPDVLMPLLENLLNLEMFWSRDKESSLCLHQLDHMDQEGFSPELWRFVVKARTWWNLPLDNLLLPPHPLPWHALAMAAQSEPAQQEAILCAYLGHCFILPPASDSSGLPALDLYREILGVPHSLPTLPPERRSNGLQLEEESCRCYMWLNYLLLLHCQCGGWSSLLEAEYERALCTVVGSASQEAVWCQYLLHGAGSHLGGALVRRSLVALASRQDVQLNLLIWYLKTIEQHPLAAKEALSLAYTWPNNPWLLERAVCLLLDCSDFHIASTLLTTTRRSATFSLNLYKVAIFLCMKTSDSQQIHFWFERALQAYPYNAILWKLCLQYEASLGHAEHIKHLTAEAARLKIPGLKDGKGPAGN